MSRSQSLNFKKLVEAHFASLYRFAYTLANDEHTACDLTQHTFFIYANKGSALRDPAKIKLWLFTTLYREYLRQRAAPHIDLSAPAAGPIQVASLDGARAVSSLAQLGDDLRPALALFYLRSLSYPEIAEVIGATVADVLDRVAEGKARLKQILAGAPS